MKKKIYMAAIALLCALFLDPAPAQVQNAQSFRLAIIIVESEEEAKEIIALVKAGELFSDLARQRSIGPNAARGGDIGAFELDALDPEAQKIVAGIETGGLSPIFKTSIGYAILKKTTDQYFRSGYEKYKKGDFDGALKDFEEDARINPSNHLSFAYMGYIKERKGVYGEALKSYEIWAALNPGDHLSEAALGRAYAKLGLYVQGKAHLLKAVEKGPSFHQAYNDLAWLHALWGENLEEGIRFARKAIDLNPKSANYLETLAILYFKKKEFGRAIEELEKALAIEPENARLAEELLKFKAAAQRGAAKIKDSGEGKKTSPQNSPRASAPFQRNLMRLTKFL